MLFLFVLCVLINPLTSPGEGVTVFTSPYLSAGAPALDEAKGLFQEQNLKKVVLIKKLTIKILKITNLYIINIYILNKH